ncbi:hypothetical protein G7Y79_00041g077850 [Physcia stellaris]|nr:hypothetical protein G7Y79_00041g077850 [Physcia stellaris]
MPLGFLSKSRLAVLAGIPLFLLSIHVVAKAVFTLKEYDHQLDNDISVLLAISRRHFYRWRSAGRRSLNQLLDAMVTEKIRLRSKIGRAPRINWWKDYQIISSLIKEFWTGRAIRKTHHDRWRKAMASRRLDLRIRMLLDLYDDDGDDNGTYVFVRHRDGVPLVLTKSGTMIEEIYLPGDRSADGGSGTDNLNEMDQAEANRDDLSWRLSEGPLEAYHYPYFRHQKGEIAR